jgi:hypothetical protein
MAIRGGTRLLIATGEAATSEDELPRLVRALIDSASEVLVMTPVLVSRLQWPAITRAGRNMACSIRSGGSAFQ